MMASKPPWEEKIPKTNRRCSKPLSFSIQISTTPRLCGAFAGQEALEARHVTRPASDPTHLIWSCQP